MCSMHFLIIHKRAKIFSGQSKRATFSRKEYFHGMRTLLFEIIKNKKLIQTYSEIVKACRN